MKELTDWKSSLQIYNHSTNDTPVSFVWQLHRQRLMSLLCNKIRTSAKLNKHYPDLFTNVQICPMCTIEQDEETHWMQYTQHMGSLQ